MGVCLLFYTAMRAYLMSFTHDESITWLTYLHEPFMAVISNNTKSISANNHILNTLFMQLFSFLFGNSEFSLRLHSVLAHAVYMFFCYRILQLIKPGYAVAFGFVLLNLNPFLLDFFSLARGYGLALAFMMISLYYFLSCYKSNRQKDVVISFLAACFAVISNFTLLNYFFVLLVVYQIILWKKNKSLRAVISGNKITFIFVAVMTVFCFEPMRMLIKSNQFYFGGTTGLWHDTLNVSVESFFYHQPYYFPGAIILNGLVLLTVFFFSVRIIYQLIKRKWPEETDSYVFICFVLFSGIILLALIQNLIFKSPFPQERTALFLVPLFFICLSYFFIFISESKKTAGITGKILMFGFVLGLAFHFFKSMNLTKTNAWFYDASTKEMLYDLKKDTELRHPGKKITLGISWLHEPVINFYRVARNANWLNEVTRDGAKGYYDYYYVIKEEGMEFHKNTVELMKDYKISISKLYRNR